MSRIRCTRGVYRSPKIMSNWVNIGSPAHIIWLERIWMMSWNTNSYDVSLFLFLSLHLALPPSLSILYYLAWEYGCIQMEIDRGIQSIHSNVQSNCSTEWRAQLTFNIWSTHFFPLQKFYSHFLSTFPLRLFFTYFTHERCMLWTET